MWLHNVHTVHNIHTVHKMIPRLIAHRGAMAQAPENTITAFDTALERGLHGLEFDVQLSKDEVPVIFHDNTLLRVTGESGRIFDYTYEELSRFDYGSWFSKEFAGAGLPTLEEVLLRYVEKADLMIELKTGSQPPDSEPVRRLVDKSVALVGELVPESRRESVYMLCFDHNVLLGVRKKAPWLKCILNLHGPPAEETLDSAVNEHLHGYGLAFHQLTKAFLRNAGQTGKTVMTYSCNTPHQIDAALEKGVDYLLTDDPARVAGHFVKRVNTVSPQGRNNLPESA